MTVLEEMPLRWRILMVTAVGLLLVADVIGLYAIVDAVGTINHWW